MILNSINYEDLSKIAPIVNYVGGKRWLANKLISKISNRNKKIYSEVFAGGFGSFTSVVETLCREGYEVIYLNDINTNLMGLYHDVFYNKDNLIEEFYSLHEKYIKTIPDVNFKELSKEESKKHLADSYEFFKQIRERFNEVKFDEHSIESSSLLIMLQMLCFNGLYRENSKGLYNTSFGWHSKEFFNLVEQRIVSMNGLTDIFDIQLTKLDFRDVRYNKDTLYYLDPPYTESLDSVSKVSYGPDEFTISDQKDLIDLVYDKEFVYSNHNNEEIVEYFKSYNINNIDIVDRPNLFSSDAKTRGNKVQEILVTNGRI